MPRKAGLGPVRSYPLGTFKLSDNSLRFGLNSLLFGASLPVNNAAGIGMLVAIEVEESYTFTTAASDPTVPSYMLDAATDYRLLSSDNTEWLNARGWHMPVREFDRYGTLLTHKVLDLPITGGGGAGSYPRVITRRIDFLEPGFGELAHLRLLPTQYFRSAGKLELTLNEGPFYQNGATLGIDDAEVTLTAYVADWTDLGNFPIAIYAHDTFVSDDAAPRPTPKAGAYLRWLLALDPGGANAGASTPPNDDLISITHVKVGVLNKPLYERDVDELMRRYMLGTPDPVTAFTATALAVQEVVRFADPVHNTSGQLHFIPVITPPRRGAGLGHMLNFGDSDPIIEINYNQRAGTPSPLDHIVCRVEDRSDQIVRNILGSINSAGAFSGSQAKHAIAPGRATMVPLRVKLV